MSSRSIALVGNPNCGKTTLFNILTGSHQKVGNWPGVTVEKKFGYLEHEGVRCEVVDLPGIYSLEQDFLGLDEKIARDYLDAGEFSQVINIVDASNLQRNLILTQQLIDTGQPVVVALNMLDVAKSNGLTIDCQHLAEVLGVPVFPIVASRGTGINDLVSYCLKHDITLPPFESTAALATSKVNEPRISETGSYTKSETAVNTVDRSGSTADVNGEKIIRRYHRAEQIVNGVVVMTPMEHTLTERIDRWVLNKWLGVPIFLLMMYLMFTIAINVGAVFIDFFDILFAALVVDTPKWFLESVGAPSWLVVLLANGLGGGIQLVATFIPVIGCLFLCLSLLESSGYMSRAVFVIDRLMAKIGLPGNAFVPLIVGFGCNVPAVMAARSLGRESDRLLTMAMAPFMSCGARLTVYALFAAAMFPENGQNIVFSLYLLGIAMAVLTGWLFRRQIFHSTVTPSFQEMPAYHVPVVRNIALTTWFRLKGFVFRAGKTIVVVVIALSFLNSMGTDGSFGNENTDDSALSIIGKAITPVFAPIGLKEENWPATVGLFTGLFAKEAVVGTLDALYSDVAHDDGENRQPDIASAVGEAFLSIKNNAADLADNLGDPLGIGIDSGVDIETAALGQGVNNSTLTNMAQMFGTQFAAFCYLVFILLYAPCVAVLGATAKEAGIKWMLLTFSWTTGLAYITAGCIYQLGTFPEHPLYSAVWLSGAGVISVLAVKSLTRFSRKSNDLIPLVQLSNP